MTPADEDIVETLTADGGTHARDLSDETGLSLSTIYRCLDRMDGVLTSDNGHVRFVTDRLRREVRAIVESIDHQLETAADRVAEIVDQDVRQSASAAFDRWLSKYSAEFEPPESEGERPVVRIDTVLSRFKYTDRPMFDDVLDEMGTAWKRDGRSIDQLTDAIVEVSVDGTREQHRAATLW
nr:winged helix-turn-helix domain-containing protein [Halomicrobium mukohataei]